MLLTRNWWAFLLRGIFAVVFGLIAIFMPVAAFLSLVFVFGAFALVDGIFALEDAYQKNAVFPVPDRATVMLVQWLETKRPTEEEFDTTRKMIAGQMAQAQAADALEAWFDLEQLRARNGFSQPQE